MSRHHCLAVCSPGLEDVCAVELGGLGVRIRRTLLGGVEFSASDRELYAANLWLRTATRVIVRVARFEARTLTELTEAVAAVDWAPWVAEGARPAVRASSTSSRLHHTGMVAERIEEVAGEGDEPGPMVVARIIHDRVTLSVDSSGAPLYQRGWRIDGAKAPLRETLAAAVLLASGWDRRAPLADPMCGSGTIAIEAALLAAGLPPGRDRGFAFQAWPSFQPGTWASVAGSVPAPSAVPPILGSDRDAGAVAAATANAERAGAAVEIRHGSISELPPPPGGRGWLVTNPPYGRRVGGADLRDLYARLGEVARRGGWDTALLVADTRLAGHTGLVLAERLRTENGGIPVRLLVAAAQPPARR